VPHDSRLGKPNSAYFQRESSKPSTLKTLNPQIPQNPRRAALRAHCCVRADESGMRLRRFYPFSQGQRGCVGRALVRFDA